jgi:hypothetical protein
MGLGTKRRQQQTADICKQHLREKYRDQRRLVEEFIVEIPEFQILGHVILGLVVHRYLVMFTALF